MKNIKVTIYTKEMGRVDLNKQEYHDFDFDSVIKHRLNSPAAIWYYEDGSINSEFYYINDKIHRLDGPACIYYYENGSINSKYYYINNELHKTDGPSVIWYNQYGNFSSKHYYINNKIHRIDGPAIIWYNQDGSVWREEYYINYTSYNKEDYDNLINEMKALPKSLKLVHEDWWVREL